MVVARPASVRGDAIGARRLDVQQFAPEHALAYGLHLLFPKRAVCLEMLDADGRRAIAGGVHRSLHDEVVANDHRHIPGSHLVDFDPSDPGQVGVRHHHAGQGIQGPRPEAGQQREPGHGQETQGERVASNPPPADDVLCVQARGLPIGLADGGANERTAAVGRLLGEAYGVDDLVV